MQVLSLLIMTPPGMAHPKMGSSAYFLGQFFFVPLYLIRTTYITSTPHEFGGWGKKGGPLKMPITADIGP